MDEKRPLDPESRARATHLVRSLRDAESTAAASGELMPLVYDELRRIAGRLMRGQRANATLQPTELIHEAFLRLADDGAGEADARGERWQGKVHFTRVAARAMRFVLVDHARTKLSERRGGARRRVTLDTQLADVADTSEELLFVHEGLERLGGVDAQLAQIVELRFFGGLTLHETAAALGVSRRTVDRGWRTARAWWVQEFIRSSGSSAIVSGSPPKMRSKFQSPSGYWRRISFMRSADSRRNV